MFVSNITLFMTVQITHDDERWNKMNTFESIAWLYTVAIVSYLQVLTVLTVGIQ